MSIYRTHKPVQTFMTGYRSVVRAREGRMLAIRHPLDGPIFETKQDAENWCMYAMIDHFDRKLGMADAKIHPFKGMLDFGPPPDPARLRETQRFLAEVAEERHHNGQPPPGENWRVKVVSSDAVITPFKGTVDCSEGGTA